MKAISLQSGSNGNSTYVEASGIRLLFDAGIGGCQAADTHQRLLGKRLPLLVASRYDATDVLDAD